MWGLQQTADFVHEVCHEYDLLEWNTKERNGEKGLLSSNGACPRQCARESKRESLNDVTAMSQGCQDQCASEQAQGLEKCFLDWCISGQNCLGNLRDTVVNIAIVISHIKTRKIEAAKETENIPSPFLLHPRCVKIGRKFLSLYKAIIVPVHPS